MSANLSRHAGRCLFATFLLSGCEKVESLFSSSESSEPDSASPTAADTADPTPSEPEVGASNTSDAPATPPGPLERSPNELFFPAKAGTNLGFNFEKLSDLHALAGRVEIPEWGAEAEGSPLALRDDDLDTAWVCNPISASACAVGMHLPAPAQVKALRFFVGAGPTGDVWRDHGRIKQLRLHTDQGYADVPVTDDNTHMYVVLGKPVKTQRLIVEVLDTWGGRKDHDLHFAELEVYGIDGEPREPWDLDPKATFVRFEDPPYRRYSDQYEAGESFLYHVRPDGSVGRFAAGTALFGRSGDRLLLLERLSGAQCPVARGTYFLLDQKTRMVMPLGELSGMRGSVFALEDGTGFGVGYTDEFTTTLYGVVIDGSTYLRKRTPLREDKREHDSFEAWGLDRDALQFAGLPLGASGCRPAGSTDMSALHEASSSTEGRRRRRGKAEDPKGWLVCPVGTSTAYALDPGQCGSSWEVALVNEAGDLVGRESGKGQGSFVRARRPHDATLLLQVGSADEDFRVFRLDEEGLSAEPQPSAFGLPPPAECRRACDDDFANPNRPGL